MANLQTAIEALLRFLAHIGALLVSLLVAFEYWLRGQLQGLGLPHVMQTGILVVAAIVLVVAALRLFGGLIRIVVVLVLALIVLHLVLPIIHA